MDPLPADPVDWSASGCAVAREGGIGIVYFDVTDGGDLVLVPHGRAVCLGRTGGKTNLGHHDAGT